MDRIKARRILAAATLPSADLAVPVARALCEGGLDVMEVVFRSRGAAASIERIRAHVPDMQVGAGTLLTCAQIEEALAAGAQFGVSPGFNPTVVKAAQNLGLVFIPGVATPGEMERALELGCETVKFFPAEAAGGVKFLRAVAGPYAHTALRVIPFGGIGPHNLTDYLANPLVAAVGGSWIVHREKVLAGDWKGITELAQGAVSLAASVGRDLASQSHVSEQMKNANCEGHP
ncbi:MAG: bifunctional 4-hydroxy-2-oxoglutarate aldolase/2-dehydro-3-deoxy-phosphogluconate aldolase [Acidobacteria bacterium]|nr:bifunctional 4-hydroxy-2-oxoglutarate aldolase/2-dehydro-3-deoxy-phosphogluconate aldolase [Acidobacteriota bacterium]